jgi:acetolactate synthase I/II/III large subunit
MDLLNGIQAVSEATSQVTRTVASHLVQALAAEGVRHIFGYPGGAALPVYDALARHAALAGGEGIEHLLVRHEQSAVHAADGYARVSGEVGVCLVSSGPGVTNAVTGIATAYMDSIPLVIITGQAPSHALGQDAFQEVDTIGITRSCVKHSVMLMDPERVERVVREAFHLARSGRPGPVLIDLPRDVAGMPMTRPFQLGTVQLRKHLRPPTPHGRQLVAAARAIAEARQPLIYFGGGVVASGAQAELHALAALAGAPVTGTLMGLGAFDATQPQWLGMLGMHGVAEANLATQHCDLLIAVGARFDDRVIGDPVDFARVQRRIVHIDIDPSSITKRVRADIPIVGDCRQALAALNALLHEQAPSLSATHDRLAGWWSRIAEWRALRCLDYPRSTDRIKPQDVIERLDAWAGGRDVILSSDVGQHQMWAAQYFRFRRPRQWINSGGLGTMGFGLPAAIGAAIAARRHRPGTPVLCITGDGSLQMSTKELSTCLQLGLPIKIVCLNNSQLGMVRQQQDFFHGGRRSQSYMASLPDFVKLAQAYGHTGLRARTPDELGPALTEALDRTPGLALLEIVTDRSENVYPTLASNHPLTEMILRAPVSAEDL